MAADPTGDWRVKDGVANIRVAICNGRLWGAVSWEKTPGGLDKENPDPAKRTRPTLGVAILLNMIKKDPAKDEWDGKIYDASGGHIWTSKVISTKPDELEVQGCFGFCMGQTWKRPPATGPGSIAEGAKVPTPASTNPNLSPPSGVKAPIKSAPVPKAAPAPKAAAPLPTASAAGDIGDVCALPEVAAGAVP